VIRILVVDDHPVVREGLVATLEDDPEFTVVGAAGSAEDALALARSQRPDVVLLDLELPGMDGLAAIPALTAAHPDARILILTAYDTDERVIGAIRSGAKGYLLKGAGLEEIARAIRTVHGGESYLEPRIAAKVLAADGRSNKQIARALKLTERTVKFHVTTILNKLGAENRAQAVALAVQRGLL